LVVAAAGFAMAALATSSSMAQEQQQLSQPGWTKLCGDVNVLALPGEQNADTQPEPRTVELCITLREQLNQRTGQLVASAALRERGSGEARFLVAVVPLGVNLRADPQARIDGGEPIPLEYVRCQPTGCIAEGEVSAPVVQALRIGSQLVIEAQGPRGGPMNVPFPLAGFTAAHGGEPTDAAEYRAQLQQFVKAIRDHRAAQLRREMQMLQGGQQQPPQQPQPSSPAVPPIGR
jgi:invasion protein IalB